ncbi:MAG: DUF4157 domain-containing protein [Crocinitomicaceae bacterium]
MKTSADNTHESQNSVSPRVASETNNGGTAQLVDNRSSVAVQRKLQDSMTASGENNANPIQRKNNTGLPDNLKSGIENLSGYSMDDVKVHYNSSKPAQLQAHAYAQGSDIHLASGQEKHLPHEAWHVVQQKQGRVQPTKQLKSKVNINDDSGLEHEADVMGEKAVSAGNINPIQQKLSNEAISKNFSTPAQLVYILNEADNGNIVSFLTYLKGLKERPNYHNTIGNLKVSDTIPFDKIVSKTVSEGKPEIAEAFECYFTGNVPGSEKIQAILGALSVHLDVIYGKPVLNDIRTRKKFARGWKDDETNPGGVTFETKGMTNEDILETVGSDVRAAMFDQFFDQAIITGLAQNQSMLDSKRAAENRFLGSYSEWMGSGMGVPEMVSVPAGTVLYKLMAPSSTPNFKNTYSAYYLDQDTYNLVKNEGRFMDLLGLPTLSHAAVYGVYKITSITATNVYKSAVAPAVTKAGRRNSGQYTHNHPGGLVQTLIVDSNNFKIWNKTPAPIEILDPDEQAVESLSNTNYFSIPGRAFMKGVIRDDAKRKFNHDH